MNMTNTVRIIFENIFVEEREVTWSLNLVPSRKGVEVQAKLLTASIKIPGMVNDYIDYNTEIDFPLDKCTGHALYSKDQDFLPTISLKSIHIDYETKSYSLYFENE